MVQRRITFGERNFLGFFSFRILPYYTKINEFSQEKFQKNGILFVNLLNKKL